MPPDFGPVLSCRLSPGFNTPASTDSTPYGGRILYIRQRLSVEINGMAHWRIGGEWLRLWLHGAHGALWRNRRLFLATEGIEQLGDDIVRADETGG